MRLATFLLTTFFLFSEWVGLAAPPLVVHQAHDCIIFLRKQRWNQINSRFHRWLTLRPDFFIAGVAVWDAHVVPGRPSPWIGREVSVDLGSGNDVTGTVESIDVEPRKDLQAMVRVRHFNIRVDLDTVVTVPVSRVLGLQMRVTVVPKRDFQDHYQQQKVAKKLDLRDLIQRKGQRVALLARSEPFFEQFVVEGTILGMIKDQRDLGRLKIRLQLDEDLGVFDVPAVLMSSYVLLSPAKE